MKYHKLKKWGRNFILSAMLSCCLTGVVAGPAYAASLPDDESGIETHAEETQWKYRIYGGRLQRRLWSNTYEKWLTEWEYC